MRFRIARWCLLPVLASVACKGNDEDDDEEQGSTDPDPWLGTTDTLGSTGTTGMTATVGTAGESETGTAGCTLPEVVDSDHTVLAGCDIAVTSNVTVAALLRLEPGVTLRFAQNTGLDVLETGALAASGTADAGVLFTAQNETPGAWRGVIVRSNRAENVFEYATVAFGGGQRFTGTDGEANLYVDTEASIVVRHSSFDQSSTQGLWIESGVNLTFEENTFSGNGEHPVVIGQNELGALDVGSRYGEDNGDNRISAFATEIAADQTWAATDVPVLLHGRSNVTGALTIAAGARFESAEDAGIDVDVGSLTVEGTEEEPVIMTGASAVEGHWRGVVIRSNTDRNRLSYFEIHHASGERFVSTDDEANLYIDAGARVEMTRVTSTHAQDYGLYVEDGATIEAFANNVFEDNGSADARVAASVLTMLDADSSYASSVQVLGGTVPEGGTWPSLDVPYTVLGTVTVEGDIHVQSGARFLFEADAGIDVAEGSLHAVAEEEERIEFFVDSDGTGIWRGIVVRSNDPQNVFQRVFVRGAGGERFVSTDDEAALYFDQGARGTVLDSTFENSASYGVYLEEGVVLDDWADNKFFGNERGSVGIPAANLGDLDGESDYDDEAARGIVVRAGRVTGEAAWAAFDATTVFMGVTEIEGEVSIAADAVYRFASNAGLDVVGGALTAQGVAFVGEVASAGTWRGIVFRSSQASALTDCVVRHGGGERFVGTSEEANVFVTAGGRLTITDCEITESATYGVYAEDEANLVAEGLEFADNAAGDLRLPLGG